MENRNKAKNKRSVYRSFALISQFGINMIVPIFMCFFLGAFIDRKLGTSFWIIILFFVGALAGFRNVYIFAKRIYKDTEEGAQNRGRQSKTKE
ncbi:MAG TPA: AtpZ/AtpI family protein [Lachnospiraceae bacterium]|nr:AtpZ/AtpI family protein [Lachnospiraceae bacterium]